MYQKCHVVSLSFLKFRGKRCLTLNKQKTENVMQNIIENVIFDDRSVHSSIIGLNLIAGVPSYN